MSRQCYRKAVASVIDAIKTNSVTSATTASKAALSLPPSSRTMRYVEEADMDIAIAAITTSAKEYIFSSVCEGAGYCYHGPRVRSMQVCKEMVSL